MKAAVCIGYGSPSKIEYRDVPEPICKEDEVFIKVCASTVSSGDSVVRGAKRYGLFLRLMYGFKKPRLPILGSELSGLVYKVGKNVKKYKKGDRIFALTGMKFGANTEYICLNENAIMTYMPSNANFVEAAAIAFGGTTAMDFLRQAGIKKGMDILIYGASGSVGTAAVQLAKHYGANIVGVCSKANIGLVLSLGAEQCIDYQQEDFTNQNRKYDIIFDAVGKISKKCCKNLFKKDGSYISVNGFVKERVEDMIKLKELFENEEFKPVIEQIYPLSQAAEAHKHVDKGHKRGNVVLTCSSLPLERDIT